MLSTVEICIKSQMTKTNEMCYNEEDTMWGLGVYPSFIHGCRADSARRAMVNGNNRRRNMDGKRR